MSDQSSSSISQRELHRFVSSHADLRIIKGSKLPLITLVMRQCEKSLDELVTGLEQEKRNSEILNEAWTKAEQIYAKNINSESKLHEFTQEEIPKEFYIAKIAYVIEYPSFYSHFNKLTRELKPDSSDVENFRYQNYYEILSRAVLQTRGYEVGLGRDKSRKVYRGMSGKTEVKVGESVCFQQFLSTSREQSRALRFARGGTVFVIHLGFLDCEFWPGRGPRQTKKATWEGAPAVCLDHIAKLADLDEEWECLVCPYEIYEVTKVERSLLDGVDYVYMRSNQTTWDPGF